MQSKSKAVKLTKYSKCVRVSLFSVIEFCDFGMRTWLKSQYWAHFFCRIKTELNIVPISIPINASNISCNGTIPITMTISWQSLYCFMAFLLKYCQQFWRKKISQTKQILDNFLCWIQPLDANLVPSSLFCLNLEWFVFERKNDCPNIWTLFYCIFTSEEKVCEIIEHYGYKKVFSITNLSKMLFIMRMNSNNFK